MLIERFFVEKEAKIFFSEILSNIFFSFACLLQTVKKFPTQLDFTFLVLSLVINHACDDRRLCDLQGQVGLHRVFSHPRMWSRVPFGVFVVHDGEKIIPFLSDVSFSIS